MRWFRGRARVVVVFVMVLSAIGLFAARAYKKPLDVPVMTVSRGRFETYVQDTGKVQAAEEAVVYAPLGGRVEKMAVKVGDLVKRGQPVAYLTQDQEAVARAGLTKAQVRVAEARRAEEAARRLFQQGAISENDYNRARAELRLAEDDLNIATAQYQTASKLGQTVLVAPMDGIVLERFADEKQVLAPGAPVASVGDVKRLEVRCELLTYDAVNVAQGQKVVITGAVLKGVALDGVVTQVYPKAITRVSSLGLEQQRVPVIISINGDGGSLKPGYDVDVRITTGTREGVLVLPKSAVFQKGRGKFVYAVEKGVARARAVEIGEETGETVEITSGLSEGEHVVLDPKGEVSEGTRIATK